LTKFVLSIKLTS